MSGRSPRWIKPIQYEKYTITLSGTFSDKAGYAEIGGKVYDFAIVQQFRKGTVLKVYVTGSTTSRKERCYVTLNGETVLTGEGTYTFLLAADTTITITKNGSTSWHFTCDITTS